MLWLSFFYDRHQNGHKVMFVKDVVVHFSGILKPCGTREHLVSDRYSRLMQTIHLIPKWQPINYSFVCMLISPLCLINMCKTQKNFEVKMKQRAY